MLKKFEQELLKEDFHSIRDGLEVKLVPYPKSSVEDASDESNSPPERFILCRSRDRPKLDSGVAPAMSSDVGHSSMKLIMFAAQRLLWTMSPVQGVGRWVELSF